MAVTDPFGYERRMTVRRVAAMLAALWSASALLGHLPIHLGWYRDEMSDSLDMDDCHDVCEFNVNRVYGTCDRPPCLQCYLNNNNMRPASPPPGASSTHLP